jgi:hypothetical protein
MRRVQVNYREIYYSTGRVQGPGVARKIIEDIAQLPISIPLPFSM